MAAEISCLAVLFGAISAETRGPFKCNRTLTCYIDEPIDLLSNWCNNLYHAQTKRFVDFALGGRVPTGVMLLVGYDRLPL